MGVLRKIIWHMKKMCNHRLLPRYPLWKFSYKKHIPFNTHSDKCGYIDGGEKKTSNILRTGDKYNDK